MLEGKGRGHPNVFACGILANADKKYKGKSTLVTGGLFIVSGIEGKGL